LTRARDDGETVAVVGDYDVDGVSATALLTAVLGALGVKTTAILPHRLKEGYGFQPAHVERAREDGASLVVTVDCGTTSHAALAAACEAGLDVIVTDHHLPDGRELPDGCLLINPHQELCGYPFPDLAAAGLALKLALALGERWGRPLPVERLLAVASLGTIADLVPLTGENRVIATLGLRALGRTRSVGLQALFRAAAVSAPFSASDVGFRIGPRINAAGRLDDARQALDLLLTRDEHQAERLARGLDRLNRERQAEEVRVVDEARQILVAPPGPRRFAAAWSEGWHRGVVGIAAGRLARELHRPVLLLAVDGEQATGSGRSVTGIGLHGFLEPFRERYLRFGGHDQAVGMTVATAELPVLLEDWERATEEWSDDALVKSYRYELEVEPAAVGEELLAELDRLEPHGQGNPRPLLRVGPLVLEEAPRHFGRGHLNALAADPGTGAPVRLLGWRWQEREDDLAGEFEVLGHLERDTYRGGVTLKLVDARPYNRAR
jgi:single-stranded-DNA-specific exonuclease